MALFSIDSHNTLTGALSFVTDVLVCPPHLILEFTVSISTTTQIPVVSVQNIFLEGILWLLEHLICEISRPEVPGRKCLQEQPSTKDNRNWRINTLGSLSLSGRTVLRHVLYSVSELPGGIKPLVPTGETFHVTYPLLASSPSFLTSFKFN